MIISGETDQLTVLREKLRKVTRGESPYYKGLMDRLPIFPGDARVLVEALDELETLRGDGGDRHVPQRRRSGHLPRVHAVADDPTQTASALAAAHNYAQLELSDQCTTGRVMGSPCSICHCGLA